METKNIIQTDTGEYVWFNPQTNAYEFVDINDSLSEAIINPSKGDSEASEILENAPGDHIKKMFGTSHKLFCSCPCVIRKKIVSVIPNTGKLRYIKKFLRKCMKEDISSLQNSAVIRRKLSLLNSEKSKTTIPHLETLLKYGHILMLWRTIRVNDQVLLLGHHVQAYRDLWKHLGKSRLHLLPIKKMKKKVPQKGEKFITAHLQERR